MLQTNVVKKIEDVLRKQDAYGFTFYEIGQHSPIAEIRRAIEIFKKYQCDGIVSVGGGSPIDASKVILYHIQKETGGHTLPQIAIPTTLSAAEYTVSHILEHEGYLVKFYLLDWRRIHR